MSRLLDLQAVQWIDVCSRLPSTDARVIVVYRPGSGGHRSVLFARYSGGQWRLIDDRSGNRLPERVTHWMPVLKLPRVRPSDDSRSRPHAQGIENVDPATEAFVRDVLVNNFHQAADAETIKRVAAKVQKALPAPAGLRPQ